MASNDDSDYTPREPLTPLYAPPDENVPAPNSRSLRQGPLGARLSQRQSAPPVSTSPPLAYGAPAPAYTPGAAPAPTSESPAPSPFSGGDTGPSAFTGREGPNWGRVTGLLRIDERVTGALHADLSFGATWSSRSEMLRACLDEYYRLVASYNEARRLLEQSGGDIEALRGEQAAVTLRLREVESRLEFHSRAELRAVYLGAAEIEARLFRAEEERDLLRSRSELLEGFMTFLSRIIATVRAIPSNVVIAGEGRAGAAGDAGAQEDANPQETALYDLSRRPHRVTSGATPAPRGARPTSEFDEFILDADEAALLASSEFEIVGVVEERAQASDESPVAGDTAGVDEASNEVGEVDEVSEAPAGDDAAAPEVEGE